MSLYRATQHFDTHTTNAIFLALVATEKPAFFSFIKLKAVVASLFAVIVSVVVIIRKDFITVFKVDGLRQMEVRSIILSLRFGRIYS